MARITETNAAWPYLRESWISSTDSWRVRESTNTVRVATRLSRSNVVKSDGVHATPYSASYTSTTGLQGSTSYVQTLGGSGSNAGNVVYQGRQTGYLGALGHIQISLDPSSYKGESTTKALNSLKGQQTNIAMMLVQRREGVRTIHGLLRGILNGIVALKHKDAKAFQRALGSRRPLDAREIAQVTSGHYLAIIWGLLPLISDVQGLIGEIVNPPRDSLIKVSGRTKRSKTESSKVLAHIGSNTSSGLKAWKTTSTTKTASCRVFLTYKLNNQKIQDIARNGITNPAFVLWDGIRFSHIIDWGIAVGRFLNALDADVGFDFVTGCSSLLTSETTTVLVTTGTNPTKNVVSTSAASGVLKSTSMVRTVLTSSPYPSLYTKNPVNAFTVAATTALIGAFGLAKAYESTGRRGSATFKYRGKRSRYLPPIRYTK